MITIHAVNLAFVAIGHVAVRLLSLVEIVLRSLVAALIIATSVGVIIVLSFTTFFAKP